MCSHHSVAENMFLGRERAVASVLLNHSMETEAQRSAVNPHTKWFPSLHSFQILFNSLTQHFAFMLVYMISPRNKQQFVLSMIRTSGRTLRSLKRPWTRTRTMELCDAGFGM